MNYNIFFGGNTESTQNSESFNLYLTYMVLIICLIGCGTAGYNRLE